MMISITNIILIVTVITSIIGFGNGDLYQKWIYNPYSVYYRKEWYRIFTHALLHADWIHLFFNMYVLYIFGTPIEQAFAYFFGNSGNILFMVLYVGAVFVAAIPAMLRHKGNYLYNSVGASGAVSALVFAGIIFYPTAGYGIILIPISIPAFVFGPLYLLLESYLDRRNMGRIAHDAHIWGAVFGFIFPILLKPSLLLRFFYIIAEYIS